MDRKWATPPSNGGEEALFRRRLILFGPPIGGPVLREKSCGVVPYRDEGGRILYLVISSAVTKREHWEFPKGGVEEGEREVQTALRELQEETGVSNVRLLPGFREPIRYIYRRPEGLVSKQVVYFIGKVADPTVVLREVEAKDYRWATYDETYRLIRHSNARILLERAHAFITGRPKPERPDRRRGPRPQARMGHPPGPQAHTGQLEGPQAVKGTPVQEAPPAPAHPPAPAAAPTSQAGDATPAAPVAPVVPIAPAPAPVRAAPSEPPANPRRRRRRRRRGRSPGGQAAAPAAPVPPRTDES